MAFLAPIIAMAGPEILGAVSTILPGLAGAGEATALGAATTGAEGLLSSAGGLEGLASEMTPALTMGSKNPMVKNEVLSGTMNTAQAAKMGSTLEDHGMMGLGGVESQSLGATSEQSLSKAQIQAIHNHGKNGPAGVPPPSAYQSGVDTNNFMKRQLTGGNVPPSGGQPIPPEAGKSSMWSKAGEFGKGIVQQAVGGAAMAAPMLLMPHLSGSGAANQAMPTYASDLGGTISQVGDGFYNNYQQGMTNIPMIQDYDKAAGDASMYARDMITGNASLQDVDRHGAWSLVN